MFYKGKKIHRFSTICCIAVLYSLLSFIVPASADFSTTATSWNNFSNSNGYISDYTYLGAIIADEETSADTSNGGAAVSPDRLDLASCSPAAFPGPCPTPSFGYYDGGTPYDRNNPATMLNDYIFFRIRIAANPTQKGAFDQYHWNVLLDIDSDGYKEYWVDLEGSYTANEPDRLRILYNNENRQDIPTPDTAQVNFFAAYNDGTITTSHTRLLPVGDGSGDYFIEIQVPMTAFKDTYGNQVLFPDSPVGFVFSTGASNQDPLQKDHMMDLDFLSLNDPITFGDTIIPNGEPRITFADKDMNHLDYYTIGDNIYVSVTDRFANTSSTSVNSIQVTVTDPTTGDDEMLTLWETGPNTGIFTNKGGATVPVITNPTPAPNPPTAWTTGIRTSSTTVQETWTLTFNSGTGTWVVTGSVSGLQTNQITPGVPYVSDTGQVAFTLYQNSPVNNTALQFQTYAADSLPSSTTAGSDDNSNLQVNSGNIIYVSYTNSSSVTVTDSADIVGPCEAFIQFTRSSGLPSNAFQLTTTRTTSDNLYLTIYHKEANTNTATQQSISTVTLTGSSTDQQTMNGTFILNETGNNTGEFRNTTGLDTEVAVLPIGLNDGLWEDNDGGVITATYSYTCGGSNYVKTTTAQLFFTANAGRVSFTNAAGTADETIYTAGQPVYLKVQDTNACTTTIGGVRTVTVTLTSPATSSDSEAVILYETAPNSWLFRNTTPIMTATYISPAAVNDEIIEAQNGQTLTVSYNDCNDGDGNGTNNLKTDTAVYNIPDIVINAVLFYPDRADTCQDEYVELLNLSANPVDATGYRITDEDSGFSYTIPQYLGSNIMLQPGEKIVVTIYEAGISAVNQKIGDTYYLSYTSSANYPVDLLGEPLSADPADQVSLYDTSGKIVDYVAWSTLLNNSSDFVGDGSAAVLQKIWTDGSFRNVSSIAAGYALQRTPDGFDTNAVADFAIASTQSAVCQNIVITRALISSFGADQTGDSTVITWETISENGTAGFHILRQDAQSGRFERINASLLPALIRAPQGGTYSFIDRSSPPGSAVTYKLIEVEFWGKKNAYGPFTVLADGSVAVQKQADRKLYQGLSIPDQESSVYRYSNEDGTIVITNSKDHERARKIRFIKNTEAWQPSSNDGITAFIEAMGEPLGFAPATAVNYGKLSSEDFNSKPHEPSSRKKARLENLRNEQRQVFAVKRAGASGQEVKISISSNGVYFLPASEIGALLGMTMENAEKMIAGNNIELSSHGQKIAYLPAADHSGITFFAQAIDSIYTTENIYWLRKGKGRVMDSENAAAFDSLPQDLTFAEHVNFEKNRYAAPSIAVDPESDYWFWDYLIADYPGLDARTFTIQAHGVSSSDHQANLTVTFKGLTDTDTNPDHHAVVKLNGSTLGSITFDGNTETTASFPFSQTLLHEGDNIVEVIAALDTGAPYSIFYVDSIDLDYQRRYEAFGDSLLLHGSGNKPVTVSGFSGQDILVLDVTDPLRPIHLKGITVNSASGKYSVSFTSRSSDRRYLAVSRAGLQRAVKAEPSTPAKLLKEERGADYLAIVPEHLRPSIEPLLEYRRTQGLSAIAVTIEDVMNDFNFGIHSPHAIKKFLTFAYGKWKRKPHYVILVGEGTYDYRNIEGTGENLIPPMLVITPEGLSASDNRYADVDDDHMPEMAIGRLPVVTAEELEGVIAKIISYEKGLANTTGRRALMISDDAVPGADFPAASDEFISLLPKHLGIDRVYLPDYSAAGARSQIIAQMNTGTFMVNYVGHGGFDRFADESIFQVSDVDLLNNGKHLPLVMTFSCAIGQFDLPGYDSLSEALILKKDGGAAAVWAPTGGSVNAEAKVLGKEFIANLFPADGQRLGDIILRTLEGYNNKQTIKYMLDIYALFGDPATVLRER